VEQGILETAGELFEESGEVWEGEEDKIEGESWGHTVVEGVGSNDGGSTIGRERPWKRGTGLHER
jgi:hypothetical protein